LQRAEADDGFSDLDECVMNFVVAVKSDAEAAEVVKPAEGSFGDSSKDAEAASMLLIPFSQVWFDASLARFFSVSCCPGHPLSAIPSMFVSTTFHFHTRSPAEAFPREYDFSK
jgi:hypothetical protein